MVFRRLDTRQALKQLVAGRHMQMAQQLTDLCAVLSIGFANVLARQARLQERRFAFELT